MVVFDPIEHNQLIADAVVFSQCFRLPIEYGQRQRHIAHANFAGLAVLARVFVADQDETGHAGVAMASQRRDSRQTANKRIDDGRFGSTDCSHD